MKTIDYTSNIKNGIDKKTRSKLGSWEGETGRGQGENKQKTNAQNKNIALKA